VTSDATFEVVASDDDGSDVDVEGGTDDFNDGRDDSALALMMLAGFDDDDDEDDDDEDDDDEGGKDDEGSNETTVSVSLNDRAFGFAVPAAVVAGGTEVPSIFSSSFFHCSAMIASSVLFCLADALCHTRT